jgi:hypothetical protein
VKNVVTNARFWIAGSAVAFFGVLLVRVVSPSLDGKIKIYVTVGGQLLAILGLFILCLGVRRRIKQSVSEGASDHK